MAISEGKFQDVLSEFAATPEFIREVAANFRQDLQIGLRDPKSSSMRMLKSYVGLPTGKEKGEYLALDFGGTNVRVLRIKLEGEGRFEVIKRVGEPLIIPGKYDYIGRNSTVDQMFGFLARLIDEAIDGDHETKFYLGHTFSFPSSQDDLNNAKLIIWTKEFATPGVEGKVVNDLLLDALKKRGIENVIPVAVINDTVAVLLSAAYKQADVYTASSRMVTVHSPSPYTLHARLTAMRSLKLVVSPRTLSAAMGICSVFVPCEVPVHSIVPEASV